MLCIMHGESFILAHIIGSNFFSDLTGNISEGKSCRQMSKGEVYYIREVYLCKIREIADGVFEINALQRI